MNFEIKTKSEYEALKNKVLFTTKELRGDYHDDFVKIDYKNKKATCHICWNPEFPQWTDRGLELKVTKLKEPKRFHYHKYINGVNCAMYWSLNGGITYEKGIWSTNGERKLEIEFKPVILEIPYMADTIETRGLDFQKGYYEVQFQFDRKAGLWACPMWLLRQKELPNTAKEIDAPEIFVKKHWLCGTKSYFNLECHLPDMKNEQGKVVISRKFFDLYNGIFNTKLTIDDKSVQFSCGGMYKTHYAWLNDYNKKALALLSNTKYDMIISTGALAENKQEHTTIVKSIKYEDTI